MALTQAQIAWCAAVLGAGTAGYHAPPIVKKVSAKAKPKGERVSPASRPRVVRPEPAPPAPRILDCPTPSAGFTNSAPFDPFAGALAGGAAFGPASGGGFVQGGGRPHPIAPGVPDLDTWVQFIAGFGLIGLAVRKRKATA